MSEEDDKKRPDSTDPAGHSGGGRPAGEDPLIELARIVHNNNQAEAPAGSGRVGSTDYFADLDQFSGVPQSEPADTAGRREPGFDTHGGPFALSGGPASEDIQANPALDAPASPAGAAIDNPVWPDVPGLETIETTAVQTFQRQPAGPSIAPPVSGVELGDVSATNLAPTVAIDLEQNLTAELEDELLGALRESVDKQEDVAPAVEEPAAPALGAFGVSGLQTPDAGFGDQYQVRPEAAFEGPESVAPVARPDAGYGHPSFDLSDEPPAPNLGAPVQPDVASAVSPAETTGRPQINEDDLFAALTTPPALSSDDLPGTGAAEPERSVAGIDTLLADLDFPEREQRPEFGADVSPSSAQYAAVAKEPASEDPVPAAPGHDIDDMVWPAAAAAVPDVSEDDTPPPPEGYDLDAVARAMQESDPTLKGSGVLPPHSAAEQAAVPHAEERSRRGLFVAGGVLGVAVLGAAGFFFLDGESISVPDGPPPVISGLQEPLKIFPDEKVPSSGDNQSAKLIYDRVDGTSENTPAQLARRETPEPASLPPAPAGTQSGAELVPGATKRVRTVVVRPDGTIVSGDNTPAAPAQTQPAAPAPSEPRTVTTQPIIATPEPVAQAPAAVLAPAQTAPAQRVPAAATPGTPAPATPPAPAIVAGSEPAVTAAEPAVPAAPVPSVLPRKKPAAPVRVAQAPAAAVNPAPARPSNGPLNLTQPASAPAATAPASGRPATGSIASGTYIVQVTSQRSAAAASDAYSGLQRRYPSILGNRNAVIVAADLGDRGTFYRARIPTGSRDEAVRLCEQLQGAGGDCFVRRAP